MTKMTRPVLKYLAEINFKNWDRLDKAMKITGKQLIKDNNIHHVIFLELDALLNQTRDYIKFIDESFREYLEEE